MIFRRDGNFPISGPRVRLEFEATAGEAPKLLVLAGERVRARSSRNAEGAVAAEAVEAVPVGKGEVCVDDEIVERLKEAVFVEMHS